MELNSLATEDAVDELLPYVADEKITGRSSSWNARPILAGFCVFAMVGAVITFTQRVDLGTIDAEGLQELMSEESKPWKEGEGKKKGWYDKADKDLGVNYRPPNWKACVGSLPASRCDSRKYDHFPCTAPSKGGWASSKGGLMHTRKHECDANPSCAGISGYDDSHNFNSYFTVQIGKSFLEEKSPWATCLKKRIACGDGYTEYQGAQPAWCHYAYSAITLLTGTHLLAEHSEAQAKATCDADPGCTGYTHMTDQHQIYLVNNHALRTTNGHALIYNKFWKSCMKADDMNPKWHQWCW